MRWYISYPVLLAGLAFGLETFYPGQANHPVSSDAAVSAQRAPESAPVVVMASELPAFGSRVGAFSPGTPLFAAAIEPTPASRMPPSSMLDYLAQKLSAPPDTSTSPIAPAPQPITLAEWKSAIIRTADRASPSDVKPTEPTSRLALTRDIQRELQRVGCYLGEIDGVWGGGSQRAILHFMDRVNASLPTRDPDVFMLSLIRSQTAAVCGTSCPRGQSLTANRRCLPTTLVAEADEAGSEDAWSPVVAQARDRNPMPYGRMGVGGPIPDDDAEELSSGWTQGTGAAPRGNGLARTAALETSAVNELQIEPMPAPNAAASSFDTDVVVAYPAIATPSRASVARAAKPRERPSRTTSSYRQVQNLFQHPLGRM